MKIYLTKHNKNQLILRFSFFLIYLFFIVFYKKSFLSFLNYQILFFTVWHIFWIFIILFLLRAIFTFKSKTKLGRLSIMKNETLSNLNRDLLRQSMKKLNKKALNSAIFYLSIMFIFFFLYFYLNLNIFWIFGLVLVLIIFDSLCISFWCPFRDFLIKNKCCNSCRIYNWGYIMIFLPLILVYSFWTYSILFLALIIFLKWEYEHQKYPERFLEISNSKLKCSNCKYSLGFCKVRNAKLKIKK